MSTDEPRALVALRETLESLGWATQGRVHSGMFLLDPAPHMVVYLVAVLGDEKITAGWVCEVRSTLDPARLSRWRRRLLQVETRPAEMTRDEWAPLARRTNWNEFESSTLDSVPATIRHAQLVTATAHTLAKLDEAWCNHDPAAVRDDRCECGAARSGDGSWCCDGKGHRP